jgi:hypothetical protein
VVFAFIAAIYRYRITIANPSNHTCGGMVMQYIQQLGDARMALHINERLYAQGKITADMYAEARRVFTQRLYELEAACRVKADVL